MHLRSASGATASRAHQGFILKVLATVLTVAALACYKTPELVIDPAVFSEVRDLSSELPTADILQETRQIDFGDPASRPRLLTGWGQDELDGSEGSSFVWSLGSSSEIDFTLLEARDLDVVVRCRAFRWPDAPRQTITVEANGHHVREIRPEGAMRQLRFTLPAETLVRGRNRLRFTYAYHRAPKQVLADSGDPRELAVAWDVLRLTPGPTVVPLPTTTTGGLNLPVGTETRFYLRLDGDNYLRFSGIHHALPPRRLRIGQRIDREDASPLFTESEVGADGDGHSTFRLIGEGERLIEISLAALTDSSNGKEPGSIEISGPEIRSLPMTAVTSTESTSTEATSTEPAAVKATPNIILYLVDTLRADHLGCYGYPKSISPHLDAFADDAILFEHTLAQSSWTRCSVASVMTGTVPTTHGVADRDDALPDDALTLAELVSAHGYQTAAFVTNRSVGPDFGFQQGFDAFEFFKKLPTAALYPKSDEVNHKAFSWLDGRDERPFLLYLHTMDPHAPYFPRPEFRQKFAAEVSRPQLSAQEEEGFAALLASFGGRFGHPNERTRLGSVPWLNALHNGTITATPKLTRDLIALYDAEVAFNDAHFGAFLDRLRTLGLYDDAVIIFVADHGEEFEDHGSWSHGRTLFQEQLRVPLLIKLPGSVHGGQRSQDLAQHIDILPTLLDILGSTAPGHLQGASLIPRDRGGEPDRQGFSDLDLDGVQAQSLVEGRWKLICGNPFGDRCQLYDLTADPGETTDHSDQRPVLAGYLQARLRALRSGSSEVQGHQVEVDPELRERLQALGYL